MKYLLTITLAIFLFRVHYVTPNGSGYEIVIPAATNDDAHETVTRMFPGSYVDGIWRIPSAK